MQAGTNSNASFLPPRLVYVDMLRTVAVLLVLGPHQPLDSGLAPACYGGAFKYWHRLGWIGVDLFFVISGFLIGGLLFNELARYGTLDVKRFIIRRGFKIWPGYLVLLLVGALFLLLFQPESIAAMWPNLLHIQNYFGSPLAHTWSLAVEEHFYLFLPFVLLLLCRFRAISLLPAVFFLVVLFCLLARLQMEHSSPGYKPFRNLTYSHFRMDSLFFGVILVYYVHFRRNWVEHLRGWRWGLLVCGLILFLVPPLWPIMETPAIYTLGFPIIALGASFITLWAWFMSYQMQTPLLVRCLASIGACSYSIYLWHQPFSQAFVNFFAKRTQFSAPVGYIVWTSIYVLVAVIGGMVAYRIIELPFLSVRDRYFPSRSKLPQPNTTLAASPDSQS